MTIPFFIEETARECAIDLRDLSLEQVIAEIFRGRCEPGLHSVEFDPGSIDGGLPAGLYIITLTIDGATEAYPVQYMP